MFILKQLQQQLQKQQCTSISILKVSKVTKLPSSLRRDASGATETGGYIAGAGDGDALRTELGVGDGDRAADIQCRNGVEVRS